MTLETFLHHFFPPETPIRCMVGNQLSKVILCIKSYYKVEIDVIRQTLIKEGYIVTIKNGTEYININPTDITDAKYLKKEPHKSIWPERMERILAKRPLFDKLANKRDSGEERI